MEGKSFLNYKKLEDKYKLKNFQHLVNSNPKKIKMVFRDRKGNENVIFENEKIYKICQCNDTLTNSKCKLIPYVIQKYINYSNKFYNENSQDLFNCAIINWDEKINMNKKNLEVLQDSPILYFSFGEEAELTFVNKNDGFTQKITAEDQSLLIIDSETDINYNSSINIKNNQNSRVSITILKTEF